MSDTSQPNPRPTMGGTPSTLGIGTMLGETFSIFVSRIGLFAVIGMVVMIAISVLTFMFFGSALLDANSLTNPTSFWTATVFASILSLVGTSLLMGILALAAYDAKLGRPARLSVYIGAALSVIVPLTVLSIVSAIAMSIGFILLIVPGLYILTVWCVAAPAIVIERAGFSGLSRSAELTKGYRWPVFGYIILLFIINIVIAGLFMLVAGLASFTAPNTIVDYIVQGVANGLSTAIYAIGVVVLFARLKEVKEGLGMEDLADVFA
ncbi:hypothetical protein ACFQ14_10325 [Pseudahrensia aquimaris]|uniref:Glycerophosphoryl diester phosphodiesterase membrane domain-containing protein n=1 Tax=Pseudahrensia aquimaris TaxID=744461 RepID=A0ABW3FH52_9HYPH